MRIKKSELSIQTEVEGLKKNFSVPDNKKRLFLKLLGIAGLGFVGSLMLPKKADAYVFGSTPASNVVAIKNITNEKINPATDESVQSLLAGQGVTKTTVSKSVSDTLVIPSSGKKIRIYAIRFTLSANLDNVSFKFTTNGVDGTDFERYLNPKTGGLYGANNHPNYIEGGTNMWLYVTITGTGNIQVNIDYSEV
jgi:hypothetical protein